MDLSIVILNYNARVFLELCVESCLRAIQNLSAEIIVADNDSTDDSLERLQRAYPNIKTVKLDDNYGFSKGNNIAVRRARGTYVALVNPDVLLGENVFEKSLAFFLGSEEEANIDKRAANEGKSQPGLLGIRLIDGAGNFLPESKRRIPKPWNSFKKLIGFPSSYYDERIDQQQDAPTEILVGAFMMGKREVYEELGGLDERYFMYGEDIDLSFTALQKGYNNYYKGSIAAIHFKGESTVKNAEYKQRFYGAMSLFYEKHYPKGKLLNRVVKFLLPRISKNSKKSTTSVTQISNELICITNDKEFQPKWAVSSMSMKTWQQSERKNVTAVFDLKSLVIDELIDSVVKDQVTNVRYRFLTADRSAFAGSDSSESRGEVRIFK